MGVESKSQFLTSSFSTMFLWPPKFCLGQRRERMPSILGREHVPVGRMLTRQVDQESTDTNGYVLCSSHHPAEVKAGIVCYWANHPVKVFSVKEMEDHELKHISAAMERNGYPKQWPEKAMSRQIQQWSKNWVGRVINEADQAKLEMNRIPIRSWA